MEKVVVDASVIVKWFIKEIDSEHALKLRDLFINGDVMITAPALLPFEVLNALRYTNLLNKNDLELVAESLEAYGFELVPLRGSYAKHAIKIAIEKDITIYDASYVALADILKTKLYTADQKMMNKLGDEYKKRVIHISTI